MAIFVLSFVGTTERAFKRERINQTVFFPKYNSSSRFFSFLNTERAALEAKFFATLAHHIRKNPLSISLFFWKWIITPVYKSILSPWMAMKIAIKCKLPRFYSLTHHLFNSHYLGIMTHIWSNPLTIQISSWQAASIITDDDTIWVQHWNDFENISISQKFCAFILTK